MQPHQSDAATLLTGDEFIAECPFFLETSKTGTAGSRLAQRFDRMLAANRSRLTGARVLDLGSHDGRWSLAALRLGADSVVGIEARQSHIASAEANAERMRLTERCMWLQGDALEGISRCKEGEFDVVLLLGLYYHVTNHLDLLRAILDLRPRHLVIDSVLYTRCPDDVPAVALWCENANDLSSAAYGSDPALTSRIDQLIREDFEVHILGTTVFPGVKQKVKSPQLNAGMPSLAAMKRLLELCHDGAYRLEMSNWMGTGQGDYIEKNSYCGIGQRFTLTIDL